MATIEQQAGKEHKIAVIGGDGTGPEVIAEALKVMNAAAAKYNFKLQTNDYAYNGEQYLKTGVVLPDNAVGEMRKHDAILLGAIGHVDVKPGILEQGILLKLRFELDQYINLRPIKLFPGVESPLRDKGPEQINFTVVRENTEDVYAGMGGFSHRGTKDEVAIQTGVYTRMGVDRALRYAFECCKSLHTDQSWSGLTGEQRAAGKIGQLTLVGKTNVLTCVYDLWERAFNEMSEEYPEIACNYHHVDACCMYMVRDPEWYDVIVTGNMFGDIITDLGAMIQGGLGIAAGGNINPEGVSMFEPIGGTAPQFTGLNTINPLAAVCSGQMLLAALGEQTAAAAIERAVCKATSEKLKSMAAGEMGYSTTEVGDLVAQFVTDGV